MEWFDDPGLASGTPGEKVGKGAVGVLMRTEDSVAMAIETDGLPPGNVVHVWYGAFHKPEACETPYGCNLIDYSNPRVGMSWFFGNIYARPDDQGGLVVTAKHAYEGDDSRARARLGDGLHDALNAEMHMIIRDHGPLNMDLWAVQSKYWEGNCLVSGMEGANYECNAPQQTRHFRQIARPARATTQIMNWCEHEGDPQSGEAINGTKTVVTADAEVALGYIESNNLTPGHAASLWWAAFAAPENCYNGKGGCTILDLQNDATMPQIIDTTIGDVVPEDSRLRLTATPLWASDLGASSLAGHEILLVVRDHGIATDDHIYGRLYGLNESCVAEGSCWDAQYARHELSVPAPLTQ